MKVLLGKDEFPTRRLTVRWLWEPRDAWVGVFWNRTKLGDLGDEFLLIYIGLMPCLPVCICWSVYPGKLSPSQTTMFRKPDGSPLIEITLRHTFSKMTRLRRRSS